MRQSAVWVNISSTQGAERSVNKRPLFSLYKYQ